MIAIDTSALVAVFNKEPGYRKIVELLLFSEHIAVPMTVFSEFCMLRGLGEGRHDWFREQLAEENVSLQPFTTEMADQMQYAAETFGRGSGHPAKLNYGDCMSYAFAKYRGLPLLFVGEDFAHTDIEPALSE